MFVCRSAPHGILAYQKTLSISDALNHHWIHVYLQAEDITTMNKSIAPVHTQLDLGIAVADTDTDELAQHEFFRSSAFNDLRKDTDDPMVQERIRSQLMIYGPANLSMIVEQMNHCRDSNVRFVVLQIIKELQSV